MLVAGSEVVRQIHDRQGKKEAIAFARHITKVACQQQKQAPKSINQTRGLYVEIGDCP